MLILLAMLAKGQAAQATDEIGYHKVIAPKNILADDDHQIILWHDYGSYGLYRIRHDSWQLLPEQIKSEITIADDMNLLLLDDHDFDSQQSISLASQTQEIYEGRGLQLIQFVGPIKDEWLEGVKATGTELVHYMANNGYLVWTGESGRQELHSLAKEGEFLQFDMPFLPTFKSDPTLSMNKNKFSSEDELVTVVVQMYRHAGDFKSEAIITDLFEETLSPWKPILKYQNIVGVVRRSDISSIAQLPDVVWIGEQFPRELTDEVQGRILAGSLNPNQTAPGGPGYLDWFSYLGLSTDPTDYPIVDITDDGIGNGVAVEAAGDVTLREFGKVENNSRIEYIANCTSALSGEGPNGHGHINMSIAGGYDDRTGSPFQDTDGFQLGLGINPYGRFASTRIFDEEFDLSSCGSTYQSLIRQTYKLGARIVSNSWGCRGCAGTYDDSSQVYDAGVRDADDMSPGNQELLILFSAGNGGPESETIGTPGNGKNVITIGSSENVRPTWLDGCSIGPTDADNVQDMANFSSRGPAPGGRIKPDVVAPGTHVQGTASTNIAYNGQGVCDKNHPGEQLVFAASSGTSHSVPAIAGFASLAHAYIRQQEGIDAPSPALLKGFIIASASYLSGVGAGDDLPSQSQGYGLPDMTAAFDGTSYVLIDQAQAPLFTTSGETWSRVLSVADPSKPVHIVMAYTDQPGAIGTHPQVNDLNLTVQAHGETYLGNNMKGQWSVPGGTADMVNNVEAVFLPSVNDTALQIEVTAFNIAGDGVPGIGDETDQDFTLVCSNCRVQEDFTMSAEPTISSICLPESADFTLTIGSIYDFSDPVKLQVIDTPTEITTLFEPNPVIPTSESKLTFMAGDNATPGSYSLTVNGSSTTRQHALSLQLDIYSASPQSPQLLQPLLGAVNQPLDVKLDWSEAIQAASYELQIATDSNFEQLVDNVTVLTGSSYSLSNLKPGQVYYWRVRTINACGSSGFSKASAFSTESLPGACPIGVEPKILYQTDFEGSASGWNSSGINDTWALSTIKFHSTGTSFYAQNLKDVSDQMLVSPAITLPPFEGPISLQFWNYQEIENSVGVQGEIACYDGAILEISSDDGVTWRQIGGRPGDNTVLVTNPYDDILDSSHDNPLAGKAAWCGDPQDWLNSVVRLDDYADKTVRFRFRLGTDNSIYREGWYIDDVLVQSCPISSGVVFIPLAIGVNPES